ncbi:YihY/virulence factor BrkB family protein [Millisia brevis]|uniref:YihY/virulence factor BrkB family protein n=1 Tax=Millisia brevis TaxID=264148 RepID=UPI00083486A0|nr:YihY/virulence factor BrkB family protein [Millisia brevis]
MSFADRVDRFQRRYPASGFPLAVVYKFVDDQGGYLAALIAYYAFISLFPLLLILTTVLGFVLQDDPDLQERIVDSALSQIPVVGFQLGDPSQIGGGAAGVTIGVIGAVYGGLGVSVAVQNAMNVVWSVPRNDRPNPIRVRIRGAMLLSTVGSAIVALTVVNGIASAIQLGTAGRLFAMAGSVVVTTVVFTIAFRIGTARPVSVRDVFPGALAAAIGWQVLQTFGSVYVQEVIARATASNGVFAVVLGLLAFLYIAAVLIVFSLEFNAVRVDKLYPRSLLTPFTDNVVLTPGDEAAYTAQAKAQRSKGFEKIRVSFDNPADTPPDTGGTPPAGPPQSGGA